MLEDISRQQRGLSVAAAGCIADTAGLCALILFIFMSITSAGTFLRGKYSLADSRA